MAPGSNQQLHLENCMMFPPFASGETDDAVDRDEGLEAAFKAGLTPVVLGVQGNKKPVLASLAFGIHHWLS